MRNRILKTISVKAAVLSMIFFVGLLYGVMIVKYDWFPRDQLVKLRSWIRFEKNRSSVPKRVISIETNLARLLKSVYGDDGLFGLQGGGGGLALVGENVLGVDRIGQFFVYESGGNYSRINLDIDTNYKSFEAFLSDRASDDFWMEYYRGKVGVLGIAAREVEDAIELFVCYDYWNENFEGKTMRVSRLLIEDSELLWEETVLSSSADWSLVCEFLPYIPFSDDYSSVFNSVERGGRIVFASNGDLLVTTGDRGFDGVTRPGVVSQDPGSPFGKVLRIEIDSGNVSVFAAGFRNPQGLLVDRDGVAWATDHGPRGGDELNLLTEGADYGWPLETFGTNYRATEWPLAERQGRHDKYTEPLYAWVPSIGISNLIQINNKPKTWDGDLLVSSLNGNTLFRIRLSNNRVIYAEPIGVQQRIRDLVQMKDGGLLLWIDGGYFIELHETVENESLLIVPLTEEERVAGLADALNRCLVCHVITTDQKLLVAPGLRGVYGRRIGSTVYKNYSFGMLAASSKRWDEDSLTAFLKDPQAFIPGTNMPAVNEDHRTIERIVSYLKRAR